jgi:hypothetical protein
MLSRSISKIFAVFPLPLNRSAIFQNEGGVLKVKGYGFEMTENVLSDEAICVQEFEVPDNCTLMK